MGLSPQPLLGYERPVLGVLVDVVRDERAERYDLELLVSRIRKRYLGEATAEAMALARLVNLGMREGNPSVATPVSGEPDQAAAEAELVTTGLRDVHDLRLGDRPVSRLELVGSVEEREQLCGDVGLPRIVMSGEPPTLGRRVLRRLTFAQVREDLARSAEQSPVLDLQDGNQIRTGDGLQVGAILRPRLDLACYEVEPKLGQDLPHRGRERAPFRLVQRKRRLGHVRDVSGAK
jgi:hypothetical protein